MFLAIASVYGADVRGRGWQTGGLERRREIPIVKERRRFNVAGKVSGVMASTLVEAVGEE
jgi:hypothetical protein